VRRAAAAVIGTVAGTTLLVAAKLGVHPPDADLAGNRTAPIADPGSAPAAGDDGRAPAGAPAPASAPSQTGPGAGPSRTAGPPATTPATTPAAARTTPPATAGTGLRNGAFTGSAVKERHGTISVTITVSSGRISDATATCGGCSGESQSISSNAFTKLRQETLQAQSASIATVSGATYPSGAYKTSLQAAINAAHA
jgi:uncharacterized protein with FMN-binding domain